MMAKIWKLQHSLFLRYLSAFSQNTSLLRKWLSFMPRAPEISTSKIQGCWTQWQRFESSSIHHFWDTCQHFLKTYFCLESGFLLFLVPEQRWLAYHYRELGRWAYFGWWTPTYQSRDDFHTTTHNLEDEPTLAEHNGKGLKALAFTISEILYSIFSKHIFDKKVVFFHS